MGDLDVTMSLDEITFTVGSRHVDDERGLRAAADTENRAARTLWSEMDYGRRQALELLVAEALVEMSANVGQWLEGSLVAQSNEKIGISVLFKLGNLDDQIVRLRSINEAETRTRIEDLTRIASGTDCSPG